MSREADLILLRRFEPVVRYTRGEQFFPMEVDGYVRESSLWVYRPGEGATCLVPEGELTLDRLAEPRTDGFEAIYFLKFIEPVNLAELTAYRLHKVREQLTQEHKKESFRAGRGRLARVGYISRLVDALFSLTLLARGRVSGDTAVGAAIAYERMMDERERYVYYGRAVREGGWMVLQYWFFYPFNSWRSSFFGVNDHEADWEMVSVYLCPAEEGVAPGGWVPEWVAYASHDFHGDDLRRRWDDPELERVDGTHPVIYAGAGSHASYYLPGEYLAELEIPLIARASQAADRIIIALQSLLRQTPRSRQENGAELDLFRVPFVDYARGDGLSIGPNQQKEWSEACLLDPLPPWALHYRGLWGVYVRDPISGENAPAGPLYNRDGTMRRSWYDPVGWAGLDKVPPPGEALTRLREQQVEITERCVAARRAIDEKGRSLLGLGIQAEALEGQPHLKGMHADVQAQIEALADQVADLCAQLASDETLLQALDLQATRLEAGERPPVHAHLRHPHYPSSDEDLRLGRLGEGWAAISVGLVMVSFVTLMIFARHYLAVGLGAMIVLILAIEATLRRRLYQFITRTTAILAVASGLIVFYEYFWQIMVLIALLAGGYLIVENLRELWE